MLSLESNGLVKRDRNFWIPTHKSIHLPKDHYMNIPNHRLWRSKVLDIMQVYPEKGMNYSAIYTLSEKDFLKLKDMFLQFIEETREVVINSREEKILHYRVI